MSDDGLLNVEDDLPAEPPTPPVEPTAPVAAVPAEAAPAEPIAEPDRPAEVEAVEVGGQKYVPVGALLAERTKRQGLSDRAARADQLEAALRETEPYVRFLKANPGLMERQQPAAPAAQAEPVPDPQAELLAKTLDLYTPEGKPDIGRAAQLQKVITSEAQRIASQAIAPVHERNYQQQSAQNFQQALTIKDAQGRTPSPEALTQIWRSMPASQTADPQVAMILALTALGLDSVSKKPAPAPPASAPLVTEGAGGAARRPALSQLERNIAKDRGISETKWTENTAGFVAGRPQTLED